MVTYTERQARLHQILLERKRELWTEVRGELFRKTGEDLQSQFDIPLDEAEQGLVSVLEDLGLEVADIHRQELTAIDEALGRLEQGTYGTCDACGEEIPEERLRVMPTARYCVEDQEKIEGVSYPPKATL